MSGFATIIRDESDLSIKNKMLKYLAEIMEDSHDFGWAAVKGSQCYCVRWRRGGLRGMKPKRSTGSAELTHIGLPLYLKELIVTKNRSPKINPCHVGIIRKILALIRLIMTLVVDCTFMCVVTVIPRAKMLHIRLKTARKQKKRIGHFSNAVPVKKKVKTIAFLCQGS